MWFYFIAKNEHCCIRPGSQDNLNPTQLKPPSKARARWVAREVLGSMFTDMHYLKKFLRRPDIKADQGASGLLRQNGNEALNYLKIREWFWKQQNPMYSRKHGLNFNNDVRETSKKKRISSQNLLMCNFIWRSIPFVFSSFQVVRHYEQVEHDRQEACRRIKMDAAEGAVLKNLSLIEHGENWGKSLNQSRKITFLLKLKWL